MFVFLIRSFNDVDHMTPVVWRMHTYKHPVVIYCLNPEFDIDNDYRIRYLRGLGVETAYIYDKVLENEGWTKATVWQLTLRLFRLASSTDNKKFRQFLRKAAYRLFGFVRKKICTVQLVKKMLRNLKPRMLVFDWIRPKEYIVDKLMDAAEEFEISTAALPHGVWIYMNDDVTLNSLKSGGDRGANTDKYDRYDHVVVQNHGFKRYIEKSGYNADCIRVLGSARYCEEWLQRNYSILPRSNTLHKVDDGSLKIVFMSTRLAYRINVERMYDTFDLLSQVEGIETLLKPHTRVGKEKHLFESRVTLKTVEDISSIELCEWADVVIVIASSILIEALAQDKPVLYLKYLHGNTTIYEDMNACWIINSEEELTSALERLKKDRYDTPYSRKNVDDFFMDVIYGGEKHRDVLRDYEEFLLSASNA